MVYRVQLLLFDCPSFHDGSPNLFMWFFAKVGADFLCVPITLATSPQLMPEHFNS